ncbi:hypothetical protein HHL16_16085 [Pseudoflavitalea sp. G-6-1-2]|uniref:hypothetical protein n=1 Tax=Pseudoflavitalea sp. G-6-1-2 TaxID=2728841 RepID=UPI00146A7527|nr:hypothetical protein [Pseudoflavitalea sp. G-6-1-2]NML22404.1 hypothetical protein [Pseudoflavitalea sp. G-6-1-2]
MKYFIQKIMAGLVLSSLLMYGCKKVAADEERLLNMPSLVTTTANLYGIAPAVGNADYYHYDYKREFVTGDTMELAGNLFPASVTITIGDVPAVIAVVKRCDISARPDLPKVPGDFIKFVITPEMGLGENKAVVISANGQSMLAPSIKILKVATASAQTDTTLRVDSLTAFDIPGLGRFDYPFLTSGGVGRNGMLCYSNKKGIYVLKPGAADPVQIISNGTIYGDPDDQFRFNTIRASAMSWDERYVYLCGEVTDNGPNNPDVGNVPGARAYGVTRLYKYDLSTNQLILMNRSYFGGLGYNGTRNWTYALPPGLTPTGSLAQANIVVSNIRPAADGTLYLDNTHMFTASESTIIVSVLDNNGMVHTLFSNDPRMPAKYTAGIESIFFNPVTQVGIAGYYNVPSNKTKGVAYYDFKGEEPLATYPNDIELITLRLFDTSSVTGLGTGLKPEIFNEDFYGHLFSYNHVMLSTGDWIKVGGRVNLNAVNLEKKTSYLYAGLEINGNSVDDITKDKLQSHTTGSARYVDFKGVSVLGTDEKNNIYLIRQPDPFLGKVPGNICRLYKLHKP